MVYVVVCLVALIASGLTLFSGFGLGTLLLPAFALFFPVQLAVAATAIVHLANNLFKLGLVGRLAEPRIVLRFGLPAVGGALLGAWVLSLLADAPEVARYTLGGHDHVVSWVKLVIAALILLFALLEILPGRRQIAFPPSFIWPGGLLSGFFGGLSGHQGALRSAFLIQAGLSKEAFVGTGVACAVLVDVTRLTVYGVAFAAEPIRRLGAAGAYGPIVAACAAAFVGAFVGVRLLGKVTLTAVQRWVGALLILLAVGLATGLL